MPSKAAAPVSAIDKALSLLESLHQKMDAMPKCECSSLRQELAELKKAMMTTLTHPPSDTYLVVKKALNDAKTYADKSSRVVWIGREETNSPTDTTASDQKAITDLCKELGDDVITQALMDGSLTHKRHPEVKGDRKSRPIKIQFASEKTRNHFLPLVRSLRPPTVTKTGGNFIRRDLCPFELELERQARIDAWKNNSKAGSLMYGVRDEKLIKFNGAPRPLPLGYQSRPPRGFDNAKNEPNGSSSLNASSLNESTTLETSYSVLSSLTPIHNKSISAPASPVNGGDNA